jgi:dsDNA-specific endonuclease/ATPase MutS2
VEHYADELSQALLKDKPTDMKGSLKRLLARTRSMIIRNNKLRQVMKMEQQELEEMLRWIEVNGR